MGWAVHNAYLTLNRASALSVIFVLAILLDLGISSRDMGWICMSAIIGGCACQYSYVFKN